MKDAHLGKKREAAFSTLEILIAMALMITCLSAVVLVSSGNQSVLTDSQTSSEALGKAQELLENEQALARKDFKLVNPIPSVAEDIYKKQIDVATQPDFFTKKVTATVSWTADPNRHLNVALSTLVTNFQNAVGGDTCDSVLTGNWQAPQKVGNKDYNLGSDLIHDALGLYPVTNLDAYKGKLYVTVNNQIANANPTFFIFDIHVQNAQPTLVGSVDNAPVAAGLSAVAVAEDIAIGKTYAYVANGYGANFGTCTQAANCAQLQVIDVTNPVSPTVLTNYNLKSLGGVTGSGGQAVGNSIAYYNGYVYVGLTKTGGGPEFNIVDVHDPSNPKWVGGYAVGNAVNAISLFGKYAYVVSPNNQELIILDVSDPGHPVQVGGYDAAGGSGNGKSIAIVGDRAYLGRTVGGTEFFILNNSTPATAQLPLLGSKPDVDDSINGLIVRDYLSFLLTNSGLQILRTDNAASISPYGSVTLGSANQGQALDCEGNYFYAAYLDTASKGYITIVTAP